MGKNMNIVILSWFIGWALYNHKVKRKAGKLKYLEGM